MKDTKGNRIGEIIEVDEQTENAIFIVSRDEEECMIPAADELIAEFDVDDRTMIMELPQGLLELND